MTDSKVQVKRNFKVVYIRYCEYRIRWLRQRIEVWETNGSIGTIRFEQHLTFLKNRLKEEIKYRNKLSQKITATTC